MEAAHGAGEVDLIRLPPCAGLVGVFDDLDRQTGGMLEVDEEWKRPAAYGVHGGLNPTGTRAALYPDRETLVMTVPGSAIPLA